MAGSEARGAMAALGVGMRSVFDRKLWRQLFNSAWTSFLIKFGGFVVKSLLVFYLASHSSAHSTTLVECLALFGLAMLFWPRLMRSVTGVVTTSALSGTAFADPGRHGAPPTRQFRRWWMPTLVLGATSLFVVQVAGSAELLSGWLYVPLRVGLTLALVVASVPAVVRSVLAARFAPAHVEHSLATGHRAWVRRLLPLLAAQAALHPAVVALLGSDALDGVPFVLRLLLVYPAIVVLWGATTVALAAMTTWAAAEHLARRPAPPESAQAAIAETPPGADARSGAQAWLESPRVRRFLPTILLPLALLLAWPWVGQDAMLLALRFVPDFRDIGNTHGLDWDQLENRRTMREQLACFGDGRTLQAMRWTGLDHHGSDPPDAALACAAATGQLETERMLIDLGDDVNRPARNPLRHDDPLLYSPLALTMQSPEGLPGAELLLAAGARFVPSTPGHPDAVQMAAANRCLPCLEFLAHHGAPLDGRWPATPIALWFDDPRGRPPSDVASLEKLVALGLSPTAVGADGRTALHAAAAAFDGNAVRWLLAHGGDAAIADSDGMTPLLYAAASARVAFAPVPADRRPLLLELLALTPSVDVVARPDEGRVAVAAHSPYITQPFDFGAIAMWTSSLRDAARQQGKPIRYAANEVPYDQSSQGHDRVPREALAAMSEDGFRDAMRFAGANGSIDNQGWIGRAFEAGWWPELLRAAREPDALRAADVPLRCTLLAFAVEGAHDASPGRADSWAVVQALLDAGVRPAACNEWTHSDLATRLPERTEAQRDDWSRRTAR